MVPFPDKDRGDLAWNLRADHGSLYRPDRACAAHEIRPDWREDEQKCGGCEQNNARRMDLDPGTKPVSFVQIKHLQKPPESSKAGAEGEKRNRRRRHKGPLRGVRPKYVVAEENKNGDQRIAVEPGKDRVANVERPPAPYHVLKLCRHAENVLTNPAGQIQGAPLLQIHLAGKLGEHVIAVQLDERIQIGNG